MTYNLAIDTGLPKTVQRVGVTHKITFMKKRILSSAFAIALISLLASFAPIRTNSNSTNSSIVSLKKKLSPLCKGIIVVQFNFSYNGCNHEVLITFNTISGSGYGQIKRTCPGQSSQTITFTVTGAIVVLGAVPSNFEDFRDDGTPITIDEPVKQKLADGMNESPDWEEE